MKISFLKRIIPIILVLYISSCSEEKEEASTITLNISQDYPTLSDESTFFFISDQEGVVLDLAEVAPGDIITLSAGKIIEKVNLTRCVLRKTTLQETHTISTFLNIPTNNEAININEPTPFPALVGTATVTISNYSGSGSISFSSGFDLYPGNISVKSIKQEGSTVQAEINLYNTTSRIVMHTNNGSEQVYAEIQNVQPNSQLIIDYTDFQAYTNKIDLSSQPLRDASIIGLQENQTRGCYLFSLTNALSIQYAGYLPGYTNYLTSFSTSSTLYQKFGTPPSSSVNLTKPTLTVSSQAINDFEFTLSEPYTYRTSLWNYRDNSTPYENTFFWYVRGDAAEQKLYLPAELTELYPFLKMDKLQYSSSRFTKCIEGSYTAYVNQFFSGEQKKFEQVQYSYLP